MTETEKEMRKHGYPDKDTNRMVYGAEGAEENTEKRFYSESDEKAIELRKERQVGQNEGRSLVAESLSQKDYSLSNHWIGGIRA